MRVLTFLHSFEPGGVERVALRLVTCWQDQGLDAPLLMGRTTGALRQELGDGLHFIEPWKPPIPISWCETLWMIAILPFVIIRLRPDVLFCAGNSYAVVAACMKILLGRRCPPIVAKISNDLDRRDMPWPLRRLYGLWLRIQGRLIEHFVGMEMPMADEIAEHIRPRNGSISIIADPALTLAQIESLRSANPTPPTAGHRFVAVGRLTRQKNFPLMLKAFARGAGPADSLTIFGDGPERSSLQLLVRKLGLDEQVMFQGHVADCAARLGEHDVLLLSSDYEGVPAVILEALATGLPIIATDCSRSMAALLQEGALGRLVPVGSLPDLQQAINQAHLMHQDREESLRQARRFTLEHAAHAYLACFRTLRPGITQRKIISSLN